MAIDTWHFYIRNLLEKKKKDLKKIVIGSIGWLGNEGILYDSGENATQGIFNPRNPRKNPEHMLRSEICIYIIRVRGGHLSNGQDDIAKQSLTLLRPPFRDQLVSTREHKTSSLVGIRSLTPARRPLTSRCVPRNVSRFHETETRNCYQYLPWTH